MLGFHGRCCQSEAFVRLGGIIVYQSTQVVDGVVEEVIWDPSSKLQKGLLPYPTATLQA